MLGQGQELHMGVVVFGQPGHQLPGQLVVIVPAALAAVWGGDAGLALPAAGVDLVDVHGQVAAFVPAGHPFPVVKREGQHRQPAGGARPQLAGKGVGVGVHLDRAVRLGDAVMVAVPFGGAGDVHPPEAGLVFLHGDVLAAGPAAADRHRLRGGGEQGELPARLPMGPGRRMGPHPAVGVEALAVPECLRDRELIHTRILLTCNRI